MCFVSIYELSIGFSRFLATLKKDQIGPLKRICQGGSTFKMFPESLEADDLTILSIVQRSATLFWKSIPCFLTKVDGFETKLADRKIFNRHVPSLINLTYVILSVKCWVLKPVLRKQLSIGIDLKPLLT